MLGGVVEGIRNDGVCECGFTVNGDLETRAQSFDGYIQIVEGVVLF